MPPVGGGSPERSRRHPRARRRHALTPDDEPVPVPIEEALDLHSFLPRDIPSVVDEYLRAAHERGFTEVRVIHGKGIGVQRAIVQSLLARHPLVVAWADAPPERGGRGATLVRLR